MRLGTSSTPRAGAPHDRISARPHTRFDAAAASAAYRSALEVIGAVEPRVAEAIGQPS